MRSALAGAVIAAVALTGCGNSATGTPSADGPDAAQSSVSARTPTAESPSEGASEGASDDDDAVEIEIHGDNASPNGKRIKVRAGETVTLKIESDRAGELHVHSTREQELEFGTGETTLELTIDTPGVVDVEDHESGIVLIQLEVS